MEGREKYLARQAEKSRPFFTKSYEGMTSRDDVRDFARSYQGQNYNRIKDLQVQLPNMDRNDPRVQELKQRRRFHNRFGKDMMGEVLAMSPQAVRDDYVQMSGDVRRANKPVFNKMYPFTGLAMDYMDAGGLPGILAQTGASFLENVSDFGKGLFEKKGITGNVDTDEEEMQDYAAQTFGFDGTNRPYPQQDFPITYPQDKPIGNTFTQDGGNKYFNNLTPEELAFVMGQTDTIADEDMNVPVPFDDSNREAGIMSQYPRTNFIGPRDNPNRRPTMADVAGPRLIDRGLFPSPGYNNNQVSIMPLPYGGRGEMPQMADFGSGDFYSDMREGFQRGEREKQLLRRIQEDEFYNRGR
jgi:hypothetical protein